MKIVRIAAYEDASPVRSHDKHDAKRDRGGEERLAARVLSFVRAGHDSTRAGLFKEGLS